LVLVNFGWFGFVFWFVFGWFWLVLVGFGWFWLVTQRGKTHCENYSQAVRRATRARKREAARKVRAKSGGTSSERTAAGAMLRSLGTDGAASLLTAPVSKRFTIVTQCVDARTRRDGCTVSRVLLL
jgi:hypothetical protein